MAVRNGEAVAAIAALADALDLVGFHKELRELNLITPHNHVVPAFAFFDLAAAEPARDRGVRGRDEQHHEPAAEEVEGHGREEPRREPQRHEVDARDGLDREEGRHLGGAPEAREVAPAVQPDQPVAPRDDRRYTIPSGRLVFRQEDDGVAVRRQLDRPGGAGLGELLAPR